MMYISSLGAAVTIDFQPSTGQACISQSFPEIGQRASATVSLSWEPQTRDMFGISDISPGFVVKESKKTTSHENKYSSSEDSGRIDHIHRNHDSSSDEGHAVRSKSADKKTTRVIVKEGATNLLSSIDPAHQVLVYDMRKN